MRLCIAAPSLVLCLLVTGGCDSGGGAAPASEATEPAPGAAPTAAPAAAEKPAALPIPTELGLELAADAQTRRAAFVEDAEKSSYACKAPLRPDLEQDLVPLLDLAAHGENEKQICYGLMGLVRLGLSDQGERAAAFTRERQGPFLYVVDKALSHPDDRIVGVAAQLAYDVLRTREGQPGPHPAILGKLAELVASKHALNARLAAVRATRDAHGAGDLPAFAKLYETALGGEEPLVYWVMKSRQRSPATDAERAQRPKVKALLADARPHVRAAAAIEYARLLRDDEWAAESPALLALFDDPEAIVRADAVKAIAERASVEQLPQLSALLADAGRPKAETRNWPAPHGADAVTTFGGPKLVCQYAFEAMRDVLGGRTGSHGLENVAHQYRMLHPDRSLPREKLPAVVEQLEIDAAELPERHGRLDAEACKQLHAKLAPWTETALPHLEKMQQAYARRQAKLRAKEKEEG